MRRALVLFIELTPTRGGRIAVSFVIFTFGLLADACGLAIGHDITIGALGILIGLLHHDRSPHNAGHLRKPL